jgi:glycosyltransferase involved in cell wall biosynthesis
MYQKNNEYLVISPTYPPPFVGGSKVWTFNLVENCPVGMDVLSSALKEDCGEVSGPNNRVIRSRFLWDSNTHDPTHWELLRSYTYALVWLFRNSRSAQYKAVIAGAFDFANGWIILLGKLLRIPIIPLGNAEEFTLTLRGKGMKNWIKRVWLKFTHKKAAGFIVVCHFCKDVLVSLGVDPQTIHVVPSSINPEKLSGQNRVRRGHNVLSVGRLVERKGFHLLIEAVKILRCELPEITLTIVGDGPYRSALERQVHGQNLQDYIFIRGRQDDKELSTLYQTSDLFVLAHMMLDNGDTEGCPTVFSEASGSGLPVIGGVEGGASTVIREGETGYLVNPRNIEELTDRMRRILTDADLARAMGKAGIEKVHRDHTPEVTGKRFYEAIKSITREGAMYESVS